MRSEMKFTTGFVAPPKRSHTRAFLIVAGAITIGIAIIFHPHAPGFDSTGAMEIDQDSLSNFDIDQQSGTVEDIPMRARELDGKRVTFAARMWQPTFQGSENVSYFLAVSPKYFGNEHKPWLAQHFWECLPQPGAKIQFTDEEVRVTGTFHIRIQINEGRLRSVFAVDVERVLPINPNSNAN